MKKMMILVLLLSALLRSAFASDLNGPFANSSGIIFSMLANSSERPYLTNKETSLLIKKSCKKTNEHQVSQENGIVLFTEKRVQESPIRVAKYNGQDQVLFQEIRSNNWDAPIETSVSKITNYFYPAGGVTISYYNCSPDKVKTELDKILEHKRSFSPVEQCRMMNQQSLSNSKLTLENISELVNHLSN